MASPSQISLETIVNVVFGTVACLISIGGIYATTRSGQTQRRQPRDLEAGLVLHHQHTTRLIRQETLQSFDSYGHSHICSPAPPVSIDSSRGSSRDQNFNPRERRLQ